MDRSLYVAYSLLFVSSLLIGVFSWWNSGLISEGKNYPNPIVVSMFLYCIWFGVGIVQQNRKLRKK